MASIRVYSRLRFNLISSCDVSFYPLLVIVGIAVTLVFWSRLVRHDSKLLLIYIGALVSGFAGAKVVYLLAEGWMFASSSDRWLIWATGKTILGALLGGYCGVELTKKLTGYTRPTGDWFALVVPLGIIIGRIGCLVQGCCLGEPCAPAWWTLTDVRGVARWPAVPVEIGFNVIAFGSFLVFRRFRLFPGQNFHLYLIAYGLFRFAHEWMRATPKIAFGLSGYHFAALAVAILGFVGFMRRQRESATTLQQGDVLPNQSKERQTKRPNNRQCYREAASQDFSLD